MTRAPLAAAGLALALSIVAPCVAGDAQEPLYLDHDERFDADSPYQTEVTFRIRPRLADELFAWGRGDDGFLARIARWQIQIFDFDDKKVDYIQGQGRPASDHLGWHGVTRAGELLPDGFYTARMAWADSSGALHTTEPVKVSVLSPPGLRELLGPDVRLAQDDQDLVLRVAEKLTFAPGRWELRRESVPTLESIARFLRRFPRNRMTIQGHADATGEAAANQKLSARRAREIYRFLSEHGIDADRIAYEGLGSRQPIASNATPEGRTRNRRVEIVLHRATI